MKNDSAQGCLLGQLAGNALGSLVEFQSPDEIRRSYPDGVRDLADGGAWNTIAGQPTDVTGSKAHERFREKSGVWGFNVN